MKLWNKTIVKRPLRWLNHDERIIHISNYVLYIAVLQEALKVLRIIDDKIIYKLNTSIPTDSFVGEINAEQKCRELYSEVIMFYFVLENS